MDINNFVVDNKLKVPEDEIDNIYIWTKIASTQKALLTMEQYYNLMKSAFDSDMKSIIEVTKQRTSWLKRFDYTLSDFITISANQQKLFSENFCFLYSTKQDVLASIAFYLTQKTNDYYIKDASMTDILMSHVSDPEGFKALFQERFLFLTLYTAFPEHKLRQVFLDAVATRRCKAGKYTFIYVPNVSYLIGQNGYQKDYPLVASHFKDVSGLNAVLLNRRKETYKQIMPVWLSMMKYDASAFVHSKERPKTLIKEVSRYEY